MIWKSRVVPLKYIAMPRMELVASTLSVNISTLLKRELQMNYGKKTFCRDAYASRGISMANRDKIERLICLPKFLWEPEDTRNTSIRTTAINPENPELKRYVHVNQIVVLIDFLSVLENHASTWSKMVRIVALMMLFVKNLKTKK